MIAKNAPMTPKRRGILVWLALPVAVFLCYIGWGFYWIGQKNESPGPYHQQNRKCQVCCTFESPELKHRKLMMRRLRRRKNPVKDLTAFTSDLQTCE